MFFTALAFVTVMLRSSDNPDDKESAERVRDLAKLIEEFCTDTVVNSPIALRDDADAVAIDQMIERHVQELRQKQETQLPDDRASLIKLHDRLNYRNLRRLNQQLYDKFSTGRLADIVLHYLDVEIEHSGNGGAA